MHKANFASIALALLISLTLLMSKSAHADSTFYEKALSSYEQGKLEDAYLHLKNSLRDQPDNLPAKILIGKVLLESGYAMDAEIELVEALELGGDPSLIAETLATTLLLQKKYNEVIELQFARLTPQAAVDLKVVKATAYMLSDQLDTAENLLETLITQNHQSVGIYNVLADVNLKQKDISTASNYVDKALALAPNNTSSLRIKADVYIAQDNDDAAENIYLKGLELTPDDPMLIRNLTTLYVRQDRLNEAENLVDNILEDTPMDPMGMLIKSWINVKSNRPDDAEQLLSSLSNAISAMPPLLAAEAPEFVFIQGIAQFAKGEYESARGYLAEYVQMSDSPEQAIVFLVDVHMKLDETGDAIKLLERFPETVEENLELASIAVDAYLNSNRMHRAISLVERLSERYPTLALIKLLDARVSSYRGRFDQAITILNQPDVRDTEAFIIERSRLLLENGQFEQAIAEMDTLLKNSPDDADFLNLKAAALIKNGQHREARPLLERSLQQMPDHFSAKFNLATVYASMDSFDKAESLLVDLLAQLPSHEQSVVLMARLEANTQRPAAALRRLNDYLAKYPSAIIARENYIEILIRAERFAQAERELNTLIKRTEVTPENTLLKARILIGLEETDKAKAEFKKLGLLWQDDPTRLYNLALRQASIEDYRGALTSLEAAAELSPTSQLISFERIRTHLALNEISKAEQLLNALEESSGKTANTYLLRGDIAQSKGNSASAYEFFKLAVESDITFNRALLKMFLLVPTTDQRDDFSSLLESALKESPELLFHRNLLADHYLNYSSFSLAEPHLEYLAMQKDYGNRARVLNNLANVKIFNAQLDQALQLAAEAFELNPDNPSIVDTYGWAQTLNGQHEQGLQLLRRAYAMNSTDPSIQYHLGYTLLQLGNQDEGKREIERALNSGQDFIEIAAAKALFESLN
ncbi:XrtA/PEP-CTERM system TPR-repeat protein PrsT [Alteromonas oceanisediminis]|uniref:XrtA/PEP-CTERM system TPR-repeat protein PrsT n=1 Tax=Alteromonas oceanisediminis TaxID=2836180 RepID=UPI001BDB3020|nr:XrtA/PEP-CTERM system TPR-repeat protein PrsT [Alteromonas oceanisediminis]MBT0585840.1 PEP-CTERM system TPR-repeat protein PrsT [Alteromonas oceanisediminis]